MKRFTLLIHSLGGDFAVLDGVHHARSDLGGKGEIIVLPSIQRRKNDGRREQASPFPRGEPLDPQTTELNPLEQGVLRLVGQVL